MFDLPTLVAALGPAACRFDADAVDSCDSTNSRMLARACAGAPSGTLLVAGQQTAGRGRRGRTWYSAPEDSLTFSLLWRFPPASDAPAGVSLAVGLALVKALESLGIAGLGLKWPNDVLLDGRKLAGILVELQPGDTHSLVIGVGLNLRLPSDLPTEVAGHASALPLPVGREILLATLLTSLASVLDAYAQGGFALLRPAWISRHAWQGQTVVVHGERDPVRGRCQGVDTDGALLLETAAGLRRIVGGEVSLRRAEEP
ncbi:MAG: biotin--[acetyl-CoA-carboxylase] ligase [Proteobacteria bacterium]|nr:biotin--[acetyl-CoA-carboxylase] ligase [Pseudomonadota bacterium]HQR03920.1 biotin--[acetyl-CoA-carboxylase] ligase [Rhodocyclaceae bacterium]